MLRDNVVNCEPIFIILFLIPYVPVGVTVFFTNVLLQKKNTGYTHITKGSKILPLNKNECGV